MITSRDGSWSDNDEGELTIFGRLPGGAAEVG